MPKKYKKNIKVALSGATGRMGQEVLRLTKKSSHHLVTQQISSSGLSWADVDPRQVDIVIDFSSATALTLALRWCVEHKKPLVSGTTALSAKEWRLIRSAAKKIPILWASNMSLGIAVMRNLLPGLYSLSGWKFQIEEAHHKKKKDRPSGTALTLQADLVKILGRKLAPIVSVRSGATPGIHKISARSSEEVITIEHTALNRAVFARGAIAAARWLFDKKRAGLYDLSQIKSGKV